MEARQVGRRSKSGRPFFRERLDAFLDLFAAHAVAVARVRGLFIQPAAGELVDGAFHAGHRLRRVAGQNGREPVDLFVQRFLGIRGLFWTPYGLALCMSFPPFGWWGLAAPRGVPQPIVDRLNTEFVTLYREAKFVEYLEKQAVLPAPGTPAEFLQFLKRDRQDAEFLIRISNQSREDYKPQ